MNSFSYINIEEAKKTHSKTIDFSGGGEKGSITIGQLESVLYHIQNDDYYPTFIDKMTHLFYGTCQFHCFRDGNKRLAITLSTQFLLINGHMAIASDYMTKMENISYHVAAGKISEILLKEIITAVLSRNYDNNEKLKLKIYNAINTED